MNRAPEKLVNKDPGEKEEIRLRSEEMRLQVACGGLRIFLWQRVAWKLLDIEI